MIFIYGTVAGCLIVGGFFVAGSANPLRYCWRQAALGVVMMIAGFAMAWFP